MHSTHDTCCPEFITLQVGWCANTGMIRVRGQWCPDQLQFFDDSVRDVEMVVEDESQVRAAVVQVLQQYRPLLVLSRLRRA